MIEFVDIDVSFDGKKVFDSFNLSIKEGEIVLLSAPSGSGKSTLFNLLLGFLKPDRGNVIFNGKTLSRDTLNYFRKNISYVSQDVDFRNEVVENLLKDIFTYENNKDKKLDMNELHSLLEYFELDRDILLKKVNDLSGGERQRIGIITAILLKRDVLVLDEITSGLDAKMKKKVADYILSSDITALIISHDSIWMDYESVRKVRW